MKRKIIRWYKKWIKGECRHVCRLCKHRYYCWIEFPLDTHYYFLMSGRYNGKTYYLKQMEERLKTKEREDIANETNELNT